MRPVKCPKCELNYLRDGEQYCDICLKDMKKKPQADEPLEIICPECGENPVVKGREMCRACMLEKQKLDKAEKLATGTVAEEEDIEIDSIIGDDELPDIELVEDEGENISIDVLDLEEEELEFEDAKVLI